MHDNMDDELEILLLEILRPLTPQQRERFIKDIELREQGDDIFNVARAKFFAGRMSLESFDQVVVRQHALMVKNRLNAANRR
jgi:hypothetical protein